MVLFSSFFFLILILASAVAVTERERENVYVINLYYFIRQPNNLDYVVRYYEKWFAYARSIIIRG